MHLVDISPDLARQWLATLPTNGTWPGGAFDVGKVRRYAQAMRDGTWKLMELPVVYRGGRLLSSRNRMAAIIEADMTITMYVSDDQCPR
jgi:hypothetical protein